MAKKRTAKAAESPTRAAQARKHGLTYLGDGKRHLNGIPARTLAPAEVGRLTIKQIDICLDSGLYVTNVQEDAK